MIDLLQANKESLESHRSDGLMKRFIHAGIWMTAIQVLNRIFSFVRLMVLARLLTPKDFGVFGLCMVTVQALKVFTKSGFWGAMLQKDGDVKPYYDTFFLVSFLRGIFLTAVLFASSKIIASFMNERALGSMLKAICLCFLAQGLTSPGVIEYWRRLRLKKECIYQSVGILVDMVVAVIAAVILRNAWALVLGIVAKDIVQMLLSYLLAPYKVKGDWSLEKAKNLFSFGGWIFGISVLSFVFLQGSMMIIGKTFGTEILGFFVLAYQIGNRPTREFVIVLARPAFVAFSSVQNDTTRLRNGYLKAFQIISSVTIPASIGIALLAENLIIVFPGEKWMSIVNVLRILAMWSLIQSLNIPNCALLKGIGRPDIEFKLRLFQLFAYVLMVFPLGRFFGLFGIGVALLTSELLISPVLWCQARKFIDCRTWSQISLILYPLIASLAMAGSVYLLSFYFNNTSRLLDLTMLSLVGIVIYSCCILIFSKFSEYDLIKLIGQHLPKPATERYC